MDKTSLHVPEKQTWGTWEELLLACAVHRYGTDNWTSVAAQVQKRSSTVKCVTPHSCRDKYHDLNRRFASDDAVSLTDKFDIPWLDELKKLRVAELKREVEHYDLSIVSLQLKVKKLTEEREQNLTDKKTQCLDPDKAVDEIGDRDNKIDKIKSSENSISGEESDRENRSVNESNSTNPKAEDTEKGPEPEEPAPAETENVGENTMTAKEYSCNGSCGSAAKKSARNSERVDSGELRESVAESRRDGGEEEGHGKERESSDVLSTANLSRKDEKTDEPEEPENQSLQIKCGPVESQPLVECLEILRSHKLGSIFERRLDLQETPGYEDMIRQHIDLETVRLRLEENWYTGCYCSFFRDLLLVFNNAIVFFGKNSSEFLSAVELRQVVLKEMALKTSNSNQLLKEKSSLSSAAKNVKLDTESSDTLLLKPNISLPLIACRKRSSITARGAASSSAADKKREQTTSLLDKKPVLDRKKNDKSSVKTDLEYVSKERSASGTRSSSKKAKSGTNIKTKKNEETDTKVNHTSVVGFTDNENSEAKAEKDRKNTTNGNAKKRSAANFLNRITRSSPSKNGSLLETLKSPLISPDNGRKGVEQNKSSISKSDSRKERNLQTRSDGTQAKEKESPRKRTRGPKAAAPFPSVSAARGKRNGEGGEMESGRARKRPRVR